MNLGTIEITPEEATERLAEIERLIASERTAEDLALAQAYRAAKRGLGVISLKRAFDLAGTFDNGLPKIAVVRATAKTVRVDVKHNWRTRNRGGEYYYSFSDADYSNDEMGALVGTYHVNVHGSITDADYSRTRASQTVVPLIPPEHRPRSARRLGRLHILWEVEKWDPTPPVDPALIKHLRGDLWAVLATWDLTELERLVLTQRS
jgi:hypothetical protein